MASALVSGGKDSIFSASIADAQGWPVDELVVARPADPDSFMFHTPNLALVALQAEAWGKRLRELEVPKGSEAEEVEALRRALSGGRSAVVAGAIASSYQWSRLARVTHELGRPLVTPLWGKAPERVVEAEIADGLDIRIVQVAAERLGPELLGRRLDGDLLRELRSLGEHGPAVHPAGEGGEYESLVVDAPFFRQRIAIDASRIVERGMAARLEIERAHLEAKVGELGRVPTRAVPPGSDRGPTA